ncbi:PstS family phosphate ABC transporter substrate-binding protein [Aerosakkonemataceae cyanobacterium BLCC-F154]|uniref:PstS family phosphate ABC transporter substrate-binding protein n=1 Tax=Floridaenema fluviatile BLCC-F154 TaxID=3153640 RepID=A0ABV4YDF5_9CYAN
MSQKNETVTLIFALLITLGLLGAIAWWLTQSFGFNINNFNQQKPDSSPVQNSNLSNDFAQVKNVPSGLFNYGGSTSWAPIRLLVDSAIQVARPEFRLRYVDPIGSPPGSSIGIKMLLNGQIAFSQSSRPLSDKEYEQAQQRGFRLQQITVAIDGLAVAVNPNLNISGLTVDQLRSIYTGKITNWQELGGPNLAIKPFSRPKGSGGTVDMFLEEIIKREDFPTNVELISTTTQALRKVANTPGGIYYASAPEVVPQCTVKSIPIGRKQGEFIAPYQEPFVPLSKCPDRRNQLNQQAFQQGSYPLTRSLFVIVKQNGQREQQAGEAYANFLLTSYGQDLIKKAGFVPVR